MTKGQFKELRESIGYSQAKLAKEMGITIRTITRWERGEFPIPRLAELALRAVILEAGKKWGQLTGREYGLIREYMVADADRVIVGVGSLIDNVITVVNELRENGEKVGALHLRVFRPFPREELKKALAGKKVAVIDRDISIGGAAPIFVEVAEALNGTKAEVSSFYGGLGGRGIKRNHIRDMFEKMKNGPVKQWIATEAPKAAMSG